MAPPSRFEAERLDRVTDIANAMEQSARPSEKPVPDPPTETANPMHRSDRKLFTHLGIPGATLVGAGLVGLAAIFTGWPHSGFALATVCFLAAFVMWLRLSETKLKAPPQPLSVALLGFVAVMTWTLIGWQIWLRFNAPVPIVRGYTQVQLDKAVVDGKAQAIVPIQSKLDDMTRQRDAAQAEVTRLRQQQAAQQTAGASAPANSQATGDLINWGQLGFGYQGGPEPIFIDIEIPAQIIASFPVELKDAYIVSGTTGQRLPMTLDAGKAGKILPNAAYPIPNGLGFYLSAELSRRSIPSIYCLAGERSIFLLNTAQKI